MSKWRLGFLGVSFLIVGVLVVAGWSLSVPDPINVTNARGLIRGTSRAEVEKILGSTGTLIHRPGERNRADNWGNTPAVLSDPRFDAIFIRPSGDPDPAITRGDQPAIDLPMPRFDVFNGTNYAIQWGRSGQFIRLYFDKNDRIAGIEGSMEDDPPPLAVRVETWWRTVTRE